MSLAWAHYDGGQELSYDSRTAHLLYIRELDRPHMRRHHVLTSKRANHGRKGFRTFRSWPYANNLGLCAGITIGRGAPG